MNPAWRIFGAVAGVIAVVAALFGIYRALIVWKNRRIERSIIQFKEARKLIKKNRAALRKPALRSSRAKFVHLNISDDAPLLTKESWLPPKPIPLEKIDLDVEQDPDVKISLSTQRLPIHACGQYKEYSNAIEDLDRPTVFDDRPQYRLLQIDDKRLVFSNKMYSYFDKINYGAYLMYELAHQSRKWPWIQRRSNRDRLLRELQEPADYVVVSGVNTLTIIHDGANLRIVMHLRGQRKTACAMGTFHVIPAGEFQPSSLASVSVDDDFDLWKNIMREYAEEVGLMEEYDGTSTVPFNYNEEPFASMETERDEGNIKPLYLGTGLDTISFQGEILTAIVFKEETFKKNILIGKSLGLLFFN